MELFRDICVVIFWTWQITSLIFGIFWLVIFLIYKYQQHKDHVQLVIDNRALLESLCDRLDYKIINGNEFHYSYVLPIEKNSTKKGRR